MRENKRHTGILRGARRRSLARELAARFVDGGISIQQLAGMVGRRPALVRRLLAEAGVCRETGSCVGASNEVISFELARRYRRGATVSALVEETGLPRPRVHALLAAAGIMSQRAATSQQCRASLVESYLAGASLRELAAVFGKDHSTIRSMLIKAGVSLRARGRPARASRTSYTQLSS